MKKQLLTYSLCGVIFLGLAAMNVKNMLNA